MSVPADEFDKRLARTGQRLNWYLVGLEEARPGYRGRVFALPHPERERVSKRAHGAIRSIRNKGPRAGGGVERTISRLGWYLDGLRDAAPGYRGRVFALPPADRLARRERIRRVLAQLDAPTRTQKAPRL